MVLENDLVVDRHFSRLEDGMEHLNTGMRHLYYMIKNGNPPNDEQRTFFEGGSGEGDPGPREGDENLDTQKSKAVEDSSTKG